MQTTIELPCDLDTPVSAFLKLAPLQPRFLLESVGSGHGARYSFLGFGQAERVELRASEVLAPLRDRRTAEKHAALLDALRQALAGAPHLVAPTSNGTTPPEDEPGRFRGGLVGAASFGLARALAGLTPEAAGAAGAVPDYLALAPHNVLVFDHRTGGLALLTDRRGHARDVLRREVRDALAEPLPASLRTARPSGCTSPLEPAMPRAAFLEAVRRAQGELHRGDLYQLVLSTRFEARTDVTPIQLYRALRHVDPSPYLFLLDFGDIALVGASPEALVRVEGRGAFVQPIAGTRPRGSTGAEDAGLEAELLSDPKEAAEHVMLVDLARSDLGRVARPGSVQVAPFREVRRYREVMHLVSGVQGVLAPGRDAFDAFGAAFPAGTVVGAPRVRAMERIGALEAGPRGFYAGAVGVFGHGPDGCPLANQAIAIRTAILGKGRISVQAGAGVVRGSVPEHEWAEILAKTGALRRALTLAAGLPADLDPVLLQGEPS